MPIRGILLDFYGTVVEEDDRILLRIGNQIAAQAADLTARDISDLWSTKFLDEVSLAVGAHFKTQRQLNILSLEAVLEDTGVVMDAEQLCAPQFQYWQRPPLRLGSREFFELCPLPICIVSNIDRADLNSAVSYLRLELPMRVTSEDVQSYKPRPEMFRRALEMLELDVDEVLHVGDSLRSDVAGANTLGLPVAWVNSRRRSLPQAMTVLHEIDDLRELLPFVEP